MSFLSKIIGTFFYTGYFPIAPATFASLVFVLAYALIPGGQWLAHPIVVAATLLISVPASTAVEKVYGKDAGKIVIDEVVGMQMILVFAAPSTLGLVAAFFLFRLFDIWKPPPAGAAQNLPRGWGVVFDDVAAGLYARVVLILAALATERLGVFL